MRVAEVTFTMEDTDTEVVFKRERERWAVLVALYVDGNRISYQWDAERIGTRRPGTVQALKFARRAMKQHAEEKDG